jgi:hypothetical protein
VPNHLLASVNPAAAVAASIMIFLLVPCLPRSAPLSHLPSGCFGHPFLTLFPESIPAGSEPLAQSLRLISADLAVTADPAPLLSTGINPAVHADNPAAGPAIFTVVGGKANLHQHSQGQKRRYCDQNPASHLFSPNL